LLKADAVAAGKDACLHDVLLHT